MTIEESNAALRRAVQTRRESQAAGKPHEEWYASQSEADSVHHVTEPLHRRSTVHPTSQAFFDLCDQIKAMHASKSRDYGCPSGTDPLANIRNGAKFVGIPAFKAAMVRLSDKVTRLATYNATGRLEFEGVEDTLMDLASYAMLSLVLLREENDG